MSLSKKKNPHAVALGRLGGVASAPARLLKISPAKRSAIARKASRARWAKHAKESGD